MNRNELLVFMKNRINESDYDELYWWSKYREKVFLFFNRKFNVKPTLFHEGYSVDTGKLFDIIMVYK